MYHHVAPPEMIPEQRVPAEGWRLTLSPAEFEGQLREFLRRGYRFVPLPELVALITKVGREPAMTAAITFDDGWVDNFANAVPILRCLGLPATFFITTDHLRRGTEDPKRMSIPQLRELLQAGMSIGSHSRTHPNVATLPEAGAVSEIAGSRQDLESALGAPVTLFAYPFGAHSPLTTRLACAAGYVAACAASGGAANTRSTLFRLNRDSFSLAMNTRTDQRALSPFHRRATGLKQELQYRLRGLMRPLFRRQPDPG